MTSSSDPLALRKLTPLLVAFVLIVITNGCGSGTSNSTGAGGTAGGSAGGAAGGGAGGHGGAGAGTGGSSVGGSSGGSAGKGGAAGSVGGAGGSSGAGGSAGAGATTGKGGSAGGVAGSSGGSAGAAGGAGAGGAAAPVVLVSGKSIRAIALDSTYVYWAGMDGIVSTVGRVPKVGATPTTVYNSVSDPSLNLSASGPVLVDSTSVYFNQSTCCGIVNSFLKAAKDGSTATGAAVSLAQNNSPNNLTDMAADSTTLYMP
jgi:hypothetical protein